METRATLEWCRRVSDAQGVPLPAVLAWSRPQLQEAIAGVIVDTAAQIAQRVVAGDRAAPAGEDTLARATRAIVAALETAERERKAAANAKAFAELLEQGAFGGEP